MVTPDHTHHALIIVPVGQLHVSPTVTASVGGLRSLTVNSKELLFKGSIKASRAIMSLISGVVSGYASAANLSIS